MPTTAPAPHAPPPAIVLVRPREEGNIGSVARAMANMGLETLILVEPAPQLGGVARGFGVGGWHVLEGAVRAPDLESALAPFHRAVGTSSGRERPLKGRRIVESRRLPDVLGPAERVALVFGTEKSGLTARELDLCEPVLRIPCAAEHPTLNLAQAVLLVAYDLHLASRSNAAADSAARGRERSEATEEDERPTFAAREQLIERSGALIERLGFDQPHLHRTMLRDCRRMLAGADPDARQVGLLRRLVERMLGRLEG
ncbi:MAG: TrmH family RNA methyltransferase [Acidobacteriota bacterium]